MLGAHKLLFDSSVADVTRKDGARLWVFCSRYLSRENSRLVFGPSIPIDSAGARF